MRKPILCLDFDGVIHSYTSGWKGADVIPDPPVEGAISFICQALAHFDVQIFSSRSNQPGGVEAMRSWLRHYAHAVNNVNYDPSYLNEVGFPTEKPAATVTLDDRAITFNGIWPSMKELKEFKPWNKR